MQDAKRDTPPRRALLQKGAALTLGAIGLGGATAQAVGTKNESGPRFYARRRKETAPTRGKAGPTPESGSYGELMDEADGLSVGTFHASGLGGAPTAGLPGAPRLELQTFTLEDGVLFGLGACGKGGERTCAVLGGTGRFAGASGTYVEREACDPRAGRGVFEFVFRLGS